MMIEMPPSEGAPGPAGERTEDGMRGPGLLAIERGEAIERGAQLGDRRRPFADAHTTRHQLARSLRLGLGEREQVDEHVLERPVAEDGVARVRLQLAES